MEIFRDEPAETTHTLKLSHEVNHYEPGRFACRLEDYSDSWLEKYPGIFAFHSMGRFDLYMTTLTLCPPVAWARTNGTLSKIKGSDLPGEILDELHRHSVLACDEVPDPKRDTLPIVLAGKGWHFVSTLDNTAITYVVDARIDKIPVREMPGIDSAFHKDGTFYVRGKQGSEQARRNREQLDLDLPYVEQWIMDQTIFKEHLGYDKISISLKEAAPRKPFLATSHGHVVAPEFY